MIHGKITITLYIMLAALIVSLIIMAFLPGRKQSWNGVHATDHAGNVVDLTITSWRHGQGGNGVQVMTDENDSLFFSEGTYILYEDVCPFCGSK